MRIAIEATWAQQRERTGVGRYVDQLLRALASLDLPHEFLLLHATPTWEGPSYGSAFRPVSYACGKKILALRYRLPHVVVQEKADIYHGTFSTDMAPSLPVPSCVTIHDLFPLLYPQMCSYIAQILFRWMIRWTFQGANRILVCSKTVADEVMQRGGVARERIDVIPLAPFQPKKREIPKQTGQDDSPVFLFVGAMEKRKCPLLLLDVYSRIRKTRLDIPPLILIGPDRGEGRALRRRLDAEDLSGSVQWYPFVSDDELCQWLSRAILLLAPSLYEGFGLPILEAMAYGIPVLCSDIPAFREIGQNCVRFVPPQDTDAWYHAWLELYTSPLLRHSLAEKEQQRVAEFSWEHCARKTLSVYEHLYRKKRAMFDAESITT